MTVAYLIGMISAFHQTQLFLVAIGIIFLVTIGITIINLQTKYDFTSDCCFLFIMLSIGLVGFTFSLYITHITTVKKKFLMHTIYGGTVALLLSLFLAVDTDLLIGTKKYCLKPKDYVILTLQINLDIFHIFHYILKSIQK